MKLYRRNADATANNNLNRLLVGPSGSGKTSQLVADIADMLDNNESMVIADTKKSLYKMIASDLEEKGYDVNLIDFVSPENSTIGYNPLDTIHINSEGEINHLDINSLSDILVPLDEPRDSFWVNSARDITGAAIGYVMETFNGRDKDFYSALEVLSKIIRADKNDDSPLEFLKRHNRGYYDSYSAIRYRSFSSVIKAENTWACVKNFASAYVTKFMTKEYKKLFGNDEKLDFKQLGRNKSVLFLNLSDTDRSTDRIVSLFYSQLFRTLVEEADGRPEGKLAVPVHIFLDDFASNTVISDFDKLISTVRSRQISVSLLIQSLSQLETIYTHPQALTIINNCGEMIFLGGTDFDTVNYVAARCAVTPERIMALPRDKVICLEDGKRGEIFDRIPPYSALSRIRNTGANKIITEKGA